LDQRDGRDGARLDRRNCRIIQRGGNRADVDMVSCASDVLGQRHPELKFAMGVTPACELTMSGARMSTSAMIWTIVAKSTGSKSAHVELRNKGAKPEEIKEVWEVIEGCAKQ